MRRAVHPNAFRLLRLRHIPAAIWLACMALGSAAVQAQGSIEDIGTPNGKGESSAYGVSADGSVVVGYAHATGDTAYRAFRWTNGVMTDLGTLGGTFSEASGVSANGAVVVGYAGTTGDTAYRAFRWTNGTMTDLGTLGGAYSDASGVSADGSVVVGQSWLAGDMAFHAFRWENGVMAGLGTLGGDDSRAYAVSADGAVVVGESAIAGVMAWHAFRWENGVMADLGTLGGTDSVAFATSADGSVVVGEAAISGDMAWHAFRWENGAMTDLGTLGGTDSVAFAASADGSVVVGRAAITGDTDERAFRWTQADGMQSVEDWLRAAGVAVAGDITYGAYATNSDGSVVVGGLTNDQAFIARVGSAGSGLVSLADVQASLAGTASGGAMALSTAGTLLHGAHSRPLARRVGAGQTTFWLAGDWGKDDHGSRSGDLGLAEAGFGRNFGLAQVQVSLGRTWAKQDQALNGRAKVDGTYLLAEALIPVSGKLWTTVGAYLHRSEADLKRAYLNAGTVDASKGRPDVDTWGLRARLDWDGAYQVAGSSLSPYVDLSYSRARLEAYTETGGGFPAHFDRRKEKATELRLGAHAAKPLDNGVDLIGTLEAAHRFEKKGARTSGQMVGLFGFSLDGEKNRQNWLRAGIGLEGRLAGGRASLTLNATSRGETPSYWLAGGWQKTF
ncbi:autotransporter domain-containing protein [Pseudothauera nasutitermitis]|nr:autotransporter domain-containing protein [Pseudothauera nasutitermitis]